MSSPGWGLNMKIAKYFPKALHGLLKYALKKLTLYVIAIFIVELHNTKRIKQDRLDKVLLRKFISLQEIQRL